MAHIVAIVEGHGEVDAVPVLIRRIAEATAPGVAVEVQTIRVGKQRLLKAHELERTVELAARQCGAEGSILVLLDADTDCPRDLAPRIQERARSARSDRSIRVVIARAEYEAWFLAAAGSIAGHRGIQLGLEPPDDAESVRDAKGWISQNMTGDRSYREVLDQPALSAVFDLNAARQRSPSFDKMWREVVATLA